MTLRLPATPDFNRFSIFQEFIRVVRVRCAFHLFGIARLVASDAEPRTSTLARAACGKFMRGQCAPGGRQRFLWDQNIEAVQSVHLLSSTEHSSTRATARCQSTLQTWTEVSAGRFRIGSSAEVQFHFGLLSATLVQRLRIRLRFNQFAAPRSAASSGAMRSTGG